MGCTEKDFWDRFTPFYRVLPNIAGLGVENTAAAIGFGAVVVTVAGVGAHAAATAIRRAVSRRAEQEPLAAFGDEFGDDPAEAESSGKTEVGNADT